MSLPTADDLFRPTAEPDDAASQDAEEPAPSAKRKAGATKDRAVKAVPAPTEDGRSASRRSSGRVRHDEKMTVYVTAEELLDIEHARLALRRDHGLAVDRGRIVREALSIALAELEENGEDCDLVRRLNA